MPFPPTDDWWLNYREQARSLNMSIFLSMYIFFGGGCSLLLGDVNLFRLPFNGAMDRIRVCYNDHVLLDGGGHDGV